VRNPSGDLAAHATVALVLPSGITLADGSPDVSQDLGSLPPLGEVTVTWHVHVADGAAGPVVAHATTAALGASFTSEAEAAIPAG
jgi:hypothetical protein